MARDLFTVEIEDNGRVSRRYEVKRPRSFLHNADNQESGLVFHCLRRLREKPAEIFRKAASTSGTIVDATFRKSHIDMKPLEHLRNTCCTYRGNPQIDFISRIKKQQCLFAGHAPGKNELDGVP